MSAFFWISLLLILLYLVPFTACFLKVRSLHKMGFMEMTVKDCANPRKWFSFFIGYVIEWIVPPHIFEQYVLRMYDHECRRNCYFTSEGTCYKGNCGCSALAKAYSPFEMCSAYNWGPIIRSKSQYEMLREKNPVEIKITYQLPTDPSVSSGLEGDLI